MSDGGKGSKPRPFSVDKKTFDTNWDAIFGSKDKDSIIITTEDGEIVINRSELQDPDQVGP
jgi:hypothetical protein